MRTHPFFSAAMLCAVFSIVSVPLEAEEITVTLRAGEYSFRAETDGSVFIDMKGFGGSTEPGKPLLPMKTFMIAIPPDSRVRHVRVEPDLSQEIQGSYRIAPAKYMVEGNSGDAARTAEGRWQRTVADAYEKDSPYPGEIATYAGQGRWRRYAYARVRFSPFVYYPLSGRLVYVPSCRVSIDVSRSAPQTEVMTTPPTASADTVMDELIREHIVNFHEAQGWYSVSGTQSSVRQERWSYLILVRNATMRDTLASFKQWKEHLGNGVRIDRLDSIYASVNGRDNAERIWEFLRQHYEQWGVRYVLLVGDVDVLPIRFLFPSNTAWAYASDHYYAKLSTVWDVDGDGRWGEFQDDNFDATPDLLVGRIPYNQPDVVYRISQSIIAFEKDIGPSKQKALMAMGTLDYVTSTDKTDAGVLGEYLKTNILDPYSFSATTLYEQGGIAPSQYASTASLSEANYRSSVTFSGQGIVNLKAHGGSDGMQSIRWLSDINGNNRCDAQGELGFNNYSSNGQLPDSVRSIVFLCGCSTAPPCNAGSASITSSLQLVANPLASIGKSYLGRLAPAVIGSTAGSDYGHAWTNPQDGGAQSLNYYFFDQLIRQEKRVGDAFAGAMVRYVQNSGLARGIRVFTLLGDPSLCLQGYEDRPGGADVLVHRGSCHRIAGDHGDNGDMYVGVQTTDPVVGLLGKVMLYKSSDHGISWSVWDSVYTRLVIHSFDVMVGEFGNDEFNDDRLLVFCTLSDRTVHAFRFPLTGGPYEDIVVSTEGAGVHPRNVWAARSLEPRAYRIHLTYDVFIDGSTTSFQTHVCKSNTNGSAWQDFDSFSGYLKPSIDAGPGDIVHLLAMKDSPNDDICYQRSTDGGENWSGWTVMTTGDGGSHHDANTPVVAASTDPGVPTVWAAYSYTAPGGDLDIRYAVSQDGGGTWSLDRVVAGNKDDEDMLHMKGYRQSANRWMNLIYVTNTQAGGFPNVMWRWVNGATPTVWSTPRIVNDHVADAIFTPRVMYSPGSPLPGSGVVYVTSDRDVYFTAPWLPGGATFSADDLAALLSATPAGSVITLRFSLPQGGQTRLMIHDALGRLVRTLADCELAAGIHTYQWDGTRSTGDVVTPGRYLCTIETASTSRSVEVLRAPAASGVTGRPKSAAAWQPAGEIDRAFIASSFLKPPPADSLTGPCYVAAILSIDTVTNEGAVFASPDRGLTWQKTTKIDNCWSLSRLARSHTGALFACGMKLVGADARGTIHRSTDNGTTWTPTLEFPAGWVYDIIEMKNGDLFAATGWQGRIYKSTNDGIAWTIVSELGNGVHVYTILEASNGRLFAGMETEGAVGKIMRADPPGYDIWSTGVWMDPVNAVYDLMEWGDRWCAGLRTPAKGWMYMSDTTGLFWYKTLEFPESEVRAVTCLLRGPEDEIYAGTEMALGASGTMVYMKPATVPAWESPGGMIDLAQSVYDISLAYGGMVAATGNIYGNVYLSGISTGIPAPAAGPDGIPDRFFLSPCFPNPFNPSTTIRYGLPQKSHVTMAVFTMLGQQVATLVKGEQEPGYHEVKFDASGLASGVFLCRLQVRPLGFPPSGIPLGAGFKTRGAAKSRDSGSEVGDFVQTRKLLLVH